MSDTDDLYSIVSPDTPTTRTQSRSADCGAAAEIGGILRVGLPGDYRPFAMKDPDAPSGYSGHDVELLEALGKAAGLIVVFLPTSWPDLERDLLAGRFDAAAGGLTPTKTRAACGRFLPRRT